METKKTLLQIKQLLPQLADQERKVGEYVLAHPNEVVGHSINSLAELCGVSNTTISRFCRRLDVGGYRELRIALAKAWESPESLVYVAAEPDDTLTSVTRKIFAANIQALRDTQEMLDLAVLEQVVDAIAQARRVDIYAAGGAGIAARELHLKCIQLGINANAFLDSQMQIMSAAALTGADVGIGISHTGMQHQVAEALQLAHAGGATTVALTSFSATPVAKAADIVLCTSCLVTATAYDSPTVRTTQLALVDIIYETLLLKRQDVTRANMARIARAISHHTIGPTLDDQVGK